MSKREKTTRTLISGNYPTGSKMGGKMNTSDRKAVVAWNKSRRDAMTPEQKKADYEQRVRRSRDVARKAKRADTIEGKIDVLKETAGDVGKIFHSPLKLVSKKLKQNKSIRDDREAGRKKSAKAVARTQKRLRQSLEYGKTIEAELKKRIQNNPNISPREKAKLIKRLMSK